MVNQRRLLLASGAAALASVATGGMVLAQPAEEVIRVTARKFVFLPREILLKKDVPVILEFSAVEVVMGFYAPELNVRADIVPGQLSRVRIVPQKAGTFDFLCDIFCGDGHEGMSGQIVVSA